MLPFSGSASRPTPRRVGLRKEIEKWIEKDSVELDSELKRIRWIFVTTFHSLERNEDIHAEKPAPGRVSETG